MQREAYLEVEDGSSRRVPLSGESFVVGRGHDADLRIDVDGVSRKHARITRVGPALSLVDLGSKNGTYINGERADLVALHHGDRIQLGPVVLRFLLIDVAQEPSAEHDARAGEAAPPRAGDPSPASAPSGLAGRLSARERQVAEHVAQGLTNVQIAAALGISRRTVATHLERIYERLGIHSRATLANLVARDRGG